MAKTMLDVQQKYGKDFVKQRLEELKAADPTGYEVREMLGESAKADLARGTELSPDMARPVTQQERAAQSAQFGQISGAQQGASPFNPMGIQAGIGVNPNAGAQGQQFAMNTYNQKMNYAAQQQPIGAQLLGMATGVATGKISDKLLECHVAREVFGADNPEWLMFYDWKELKAPAWFRKLYNKFSVQVAKFISDKPKLKNIIRGWMRSKI